MLTRWESWKFLFSKNCYVSVGAEDCRIRLPIIHSTQWSWIWSEVFSADVIGVAGLHTVQSAWIVHSEPRLQQSHALQHECQLLETSKTCHAFDSQLIFRVCPVRILLLPSVFQIRVCDPQFKNLGFRARRIAQSIECLLGMPESLGSTPSAT